MGIGSQSYAEVFATKDRWSECQKMIVKRKPDTPVKKFNYFSTYGKIQGSRLTEIILLICTLAVWGRYPIFSPPALPQGSP